MTGKFGHDEIGRFEEGSLEWTTADDEQATKPTTISEWLNGVASLAESSEGSEDSIGA